MRTGFVFDERYLWHDTGAQWLNPLDAPPMQPLAHPESAESKRRLKNLLDATGLRHALTELSPRPATRAEILRAHTPEYIDRIAALSADRGGDAGYDAPFGRGSYEIALLSAGGAIVAIDAVLEGVVDNAYALLRPPGHHALADMGYGFCLLNNIVIAVRHAFARHSLQRVAIVDWDVHHGNGTETAFYAESRVLTLSIHQDNCFPSDSGAVADNGQGEGKGYNINLPLPPGSGHGAYLAAFERVVVPALRRYRPDLIVVAAGYDASFFDPLGRMMIWSDTYREMTRLVLEVAAECCGGRLVACHEGGYSEGYVPYCGLAVIEELCGVSAGLVDPQAALCAAAGQQALQPHQEAAIRLAEPLVGRVDRPDTDPNQGDEHANL